MKILDCLKIKEKAYIEDLDNGLKVIIVPKKESTKKEKESEEKVEVIKPKKPKKASKKKENKSE